MQGWEPFRGEKKNLRFKTRQSTSKDLKIEAVEAAAETDWLEALVDYDLVRACRQTDGSFKERVRAACPCASFTPTRHNPASLKQSFAKVISFQYWVLPVTAQTTAAVSTT